MGGGGSEFPPTKCGGGMVWTLLDPSFSFIFSVKQQKPQGIPV